MRKLLVMLVVASFSAGAYASGVLWNQPWDGVSAGVVAQEFSDFPPYSSYEFDDFAVPAGGWLIDKVIIYGVEQGLPQYNTGVQLSFTGSPGYAGGQYIGSQVGQDLVFNLPNVPLGQGTWWISGWVQRPFGTGGQWFWNRTLPVTGSEHYFHNPGGGFGYGTSPIPGTTIYGSAADLAFRIEGTPEPATLGLLAIGALFLRRR